jgi:von Willebrand factor type A domain
MGIALIGLAAFMLVFVRRRRFGRSWIFFAVGIVLLVLAAGHWSWPLPEARHVAVMVDLSPSTRGAAFRDKAFLNHRISELIGDTPCAVSSYTESSVLSPQSSSAILLFSGGHFSLPVDTPPTYVVLDPLLESVTDAAITGMQIAGNQVSVSVRNNGPPRVLTLEGVVGPAGVTVQSNQTIVRTLSGAEVSAALSPGDLWPENDRVAIRAAPPVGSQRWWIGASPPDGWISPPQLPNEATAYLAPSVIVLNNVSADELSAGAQDRLDQYVRDLGGSLVILGGDHAFACGGYDGTVLGVLSPLSSSPPQPTTQWILLADASGSMAQDNRWQAVAKAIVELLPYLPPTDPVRVGQFSDSLRWWSDGLSARQTALTRLPPPDALPHGPTNLQPVLKAIAAGANPSVPTELILLTDADVDIDDPPALADRLKAAGIRFNLLAIERGQGVAELEDMVRDTGGGFVTQLNSARWGLAARQLLSAALPRRLGEAPITVQFVNAAEHITGARVFPWNPTWPKEQTTLLAEAGLLTPAAMWRIGLGQVIAAAFSAPTAQAVALADLIAQPARDPRLKVAWEAGPTFHVTVDAHDGVKYLNDLNLTLEIWDQTVAAPLRRIIPQTGPGLYELSSTSPARPSVATVRLGDRVIDRSALAGWYGPEFAAVGEDRNALEAMAKLSGGAVIEPNRTTPIQFHWPHRRQPLRSWLAAAGALCLAGGLVAWQRSAPA